MGDKEKQKEKRAVRPWDPFRELGLFRPWADLAKWREDWPERWAPSCDIAEDDGRYVVTAELPGAKKDDITVEFHDDVLTVRGEKRSEREEKKEQRRYVERSYGSFSRSFTLPGNADPDKIKASYQDGVLTVEIEKREESKPKSISVK